MGDDWDHDLVFHSDFPAKVQGDKKANEPQPVTSVTVLGGAETPLDMGSLSRNPPKEGVKTRITETVILEQGDTCFFSWRQRHRTGTPRKFPTETNLRMHFMLSGQESDVLGVAAMHVHQDEVNCNKCVALQQRLGPDDNNMPPNGSGATGKKREYEEGEILEAPPPNTIKSRKSSRGNFGDTQSKPQQPNLESLQEPTVRAYRQADLSTTTIGDMIHSLEAEYGVVFESQTKAVVRSQVKELLLNKGNAEL